MFARRIVSWWVSAQASTDFGLDALEQALEARYPKEGLSCHSDQGAQYLVDALYPGL